MTQNEELRKLLEASDIRHDETSIVAECLITHEMFCEATEAEGYRQGSDYLLRIVYAFNKIIVQYRGHCRLYTPDEFDRYWKVKYETLTTF